MSVSGDCLVLTIKDKCGQCGCDNLCDPECMPYTANTDEMTENESQRKNQDNISQAGDKQGFHTSKAPAVTTEIPEMANPMQMMRSACRPAVIVAALLLNRWIS